MVTERQLSTSKDIHRRTGRTFYVATRLLPERVRHPTYVLYGFFRICDEVVDDPGDATPAEQRARLDDLRAQALGRAEPTDPVLAAFREVADERGIADADVEAFVDAMVTDVEKDRYADYGELEAYMDGSAAAVGRMMLAVMGSEDPDLARPHATALGEAFQLTNFLRDVREDVVDRDRIYLPRRTLERHGVTDDQVERLAFSESFAAAMREEMRRAEQLYRQGVAGIQYLPADCRFAVLLAAVLYAEHHRIIREREYDVLSETPQLGTARKLWLVARTWWHWRRTRDPETVFRRVSAVGEGDQSASGAGTPTPAR
ncbi:phytoene/squalene synthase family protein [Halomicrococcus gelatinilyticus]|uniref:phytoene/squalene synthase family protein n=1 Tax=Halomicrococcus gelatinilyticus TaxID=1702103 RepID=UPI002E105FED